MCPLVAPFLEILRLKPIVFNQDNLAYVERKREHEDETTKMKSRCSGLQCYFTAPVIKFTMCLLSFIFLLGFYTHVVLSDLKPFTHISQITVCEWLLMIWMFSFSVDEIAQVSYRP